MTPSRSTVSSLTSSATGQTDPDFLDPAPPFLPAHRPRLGAEKSANGVDFALRHEGCDLPNSDLAQAAEAIYSSLFRTNSRWIGRDQSMFSKQTLFVVGAGASVEFGLPVGKTLATTIQGKMDIRFQFPDKPLGGGDFELFTQLTHRRRNEAQSFQQAALLIRNGIGLALSIDDFLDLHRANKYVNEYGKAAIVKSILEAEHASSLFFAGPAERDLFNPEKCKDTWIMKFFSMLSRGVPREERQNVFDHVSFITFNYDRCIEHFLENALQSLYAISNQEAVDLVKKLSIIHPYGKVEDVAFGTTRTDYAELAASIKTYTERVHVAEVIDKIHEEVLRAETITFLGFGYHDQNMSLIEPVNPIPIPKDIFGTAYGMSISNSNVTTNQILRWFDEGLTQENPRECGFRLQTWPVAISSIIMQRHLSHGVKV